MRISQCQSVQPSWLPCDASQVAWIAPGIARCPRSSPESGWEECLDWWAARILRHPAMASIYLYPKLDQYWNNKIDLLSLFPAEYSKSTSHLLDKTVIINRCFFWDDEYVLLFRFGNFFWISQYLYNLKYVKVLNSLLADHNFLNKFLLIC